MKNLIVLLLLATIALSCKKEDDSPKEPTGGIKGMVVSLDFRIKYTDIQGQDLLNPNTPNALRYHSLVIYDIANDGQRVNKYSLKNYVYLNDNPGQPDGYILRMTFEKGILNKETKRMVRLIKYSDGTEDKFEGEFKITSSQFILEKLWVNGQLHASTRDAVNQNVVQLVK